MKVIGIGDNVVDKYVHTNTMYPGGNALNFSVYAKRLGVESSYIGVFGSDAAAAHIIATLRELGIDFSRSRHHEGENGYALVDLVDGDRVFVGGNKGGVQNDYPIRLTEGDLAYIKAFQLVHSSCYSEMEDELHKIHAIGVPVSFDFSGEWDEAQLKAVCPYVKYAFLSCGHLQDGEIMEVLSAVHSYGSSMAIATMGSRGAFLYNGCSFYRQEPNKVVAKDTLGAGDAFFTAFIVSYLAARSRGETNEEELLQASLDEGAVFASQICMVDGAFGYGIPFFEA